MTIGSNVFWVVPSTNADSAGFRVRTAPIAKTLEELGHTVTIITLPDFPSKLPEIIQKVGKVIIAKPSDASTYLCIRHLREHGIHVIADLFDNYLSWSPALYKKKLHWQWLRIISSVSGVIVSTDYLHDVVASIFEVPISLVHDPINSALAGDWQRYEKKWTDSSTLECLWFGIHGNPYFLAGLDDVLSWIKVLSRIQESMPERRVSITLCTNRVSEVEPTLALLRANAINARFIQWSEEVCTQLMRSSHVVVIPTNLSGFSMSKTHNRCSDALSAGCLVMTNPHSPYRDIPGGVHSSTDNLIHTIRGGAASVKDEIGKSIDYLQQHYSLAASAQAMHKSLTGLTIQPAKPSSGSKVLIVASTNISTVKNSRILGYISASFKDNGAQINFDLLYDGYSTEEQSLALVFTAAGLKATLQALRQDPDADWSESGNILTCKLGTMTARFDLEKLTCHINEPELEKAALAIEAIRQLSKTNTSLKENWIDINIALVFEITKHFCLTNTELASDEPGGWKAYVAAAARPLQTLEDRLQQQCIEYHGSELRIASEKAA
jgi:hypothetical protein